VNSGIISEISLISLSVFLDFAHDFQVNEQGPHAQRSTVYQNYTKWPLIIKNHSANSRASVNSET